MEIEQTQVVANSYEEAAQNQVKTTPFESPPSNPRPVQVSASAPVTSQAVCKCGCKFLYRMGVG